MIPIRMHIPLFKFSGLFVMNIVDTATLAEGDLMMDCTMIFNPRNGDNGQLIFSTKREFYNIHLVPMNSTKV